MRLTSEQLNEIMKKENVDRLWSWSRVNCFMTSPYEYFLKYIKHVPEDRQDCIYATTGGLAHNILEKLYGKEIKYEEMDNLFGDSWMTSFNIADLKFDRNDEGKNQRIADGYYDNLKHFFNNHCMIENKVDVERFIKIRINNSIFQGYIDAIFKDNDGNYNIIDFKTSTKYTGKKVEEMSGQLVVYAIGLNQAGVPLDKIKICWNFLKYVTIQYQQKNGTIKTRDVERCKIGESLQSNAKMWLKDAGHNVDEYLKLLLDTNSIDCLPDDVKEKYIISDCYVYIALTEKLVNKWIDEISATIKDIELREKDYAETNNEKIFWDTEESVKKENYYFSTLCGYSANLHKPYKEYLKKLDSAKKGEDLFGGVGENVEAEVSNSNSKDVDLSWLNELD